MKPQRVILPPIQKEPEEQSTTRTQDFSAQSLLGRNNRHLETIEKVIGNSPRPEDIIAPDRLPGIVDKSPFSSDTEVMKGEHDDEIKEEDIDHSFEVKSDGYDPDLEETPRNHHFSIRKQSQPKETSTWQKNIGERPVTRHGGDRSSSGGGSIFPPIGK